MKINLGFKIIAMSVMRGVFVLAVVSLFAGHLYGEDAELRQRIERLNAEYEALRKEIRLVEGKEAQRSLLEYLREHIKAWFTVGFLDTVNDSYKLQERETVRLFIETIYGAFRAEQGHYERTILHTDGDDARAIELMEKRVGDLLGTYPISEEIWVDEDLRALEYLMRAARYCKEAVVRSCKEAIEERDKRSSFVPLLVLAAFGDANAEASLDEYSSEDEVKMRGAARNMAEINATLRE